MDARELNIRVLRAVYDSPKDNPQVHVRHIATHNFGPDDDLNIAVKLDDSGDIILEITN